MRSKGEQLLFVPLLAWREAVGRGPDNSCIKAHHQLSEQTVVHAAVTYKTLRHLHGTGGVHRLPERRGWREAGNAVDMMPVG